MLLVEATANLTMYIPVAEIVRFEKVARPVTGLNSA